MLELYKNIKMLRIKRGMSQDELAEKTGYTSRSSIAKIEAGEVDLSQSKIVAFATALHTSPQKLMGWDDDSNSLTPSNITDPIEALKFLLSNPNFAAFGGYDLQKMSNDDIVDLANQIADSIKFFGKKYK